jgi:hypothetical protein
MRKTLVLLFLVLAATPALALNLGDTNVILPIIGRFPGAGGTQWRTDVFIANHNGSDKQITLTLYAGGTPLTRVITVTPYSAQSFPDIVLNLFGLTNAAGMLDMQSSNQTGFEARARIYNAGNAAGQFGQNVPGIGRDYLNRQSSLFGLSGINGNRLNVGVTNPNDTSADVVMRIADGANHDLHSEGFTLQPHQNIQFNDIFTRFGITPQENVQVEFLTFDHLLYGYASEVRNDTGDAIFVLGTSPNS